MSRSNDTLALESDMAVVGRGQRIASSIFLAFGALLCTGLFVTQTAPGWYLPVAGWPLLLFVLSWRVGMRLEGEALVIRGHFRTTRLPLSTIYYAAALPHGGFWVGYAHALPGIWQIDIIRNTGSSRSFPATMMPRARARRIESGINELVDYQGQRLRAGQRGA